MLEEEVEYLKERATRKERHFVRDLGDVAGSVMDALKRLDSIEKKHDGLVDVTDRVCQDVLRLDKEVTQHLIEDVGTLHAELNRFWDEINDRFGRLADFAGDTRHRLTKVEFHLFPNLARDLDEVEKIVPLTGAAASKDEKARSLDRRSRATGDSKPKKLK
jgi:hypothetical protein